MKLLFLVLLLNLFSFGQKATISPKEMHEDLDYLNSQLNKWHPTYYAYTPKPAMDLFYKYAKQTCDSSFSPRQFSNIVKQAIAKVGCGHIGLEMGKSGRNIDSLFAIPFNVTILNNKIYVRQYYNKDNKLELGDEIMAINGIKTDSLLRFYESQKTSDGYNTTHKAYANEYAFFVYNYYAFGEVKNYIVSKKSKTGVIGTLDTPAYKQSTTFQRYFRNVTDSSKIIIKGANINLQKTEISPTTFLIDFNGFSGPKLRKSYHQIFSYLQKHKAENLIIDLRDNGGGNVFGGFNFMKYLVPKTVQFINLSRKPNLTLLNPSFKTGFFERITPLFFMANPLQYPSKHGWNHAFFFVKHHRDFYKNNIYVITNGQTFSMAAITATKLKNHTNAIFIGEETGGSSYASRGMAQGKIKLPNSGMLVSLNVYQIKYGKGQDTGRGVLPDYPVEYSYEERAARIDKEMNEIKGLILK